MNNEPQIIRALRITGTGSSMGGAFSVVRITGNTWFMQIGYV